jgi:hypothetical protein
VHGCQTQLSEVLRKRIAVECKGSLCVRRNGQTFKPRVFTQITRIGPAHNLGVYVNSVDTVERALGERSFLCKDGDVFRPAFEVSAGEYDEPRFLEFRTNVLKCMPVMPVLSSQQVVDSYRGPKRRVYQQALLSLEQEPLSQRDSHLTAFVKFEKQDVGKAPRIINPRSPRYNLVLGKYLKHAEHRFFRAINRAFGSRTDATVIKGYNADDSARILHQKWCVFDDPVAIGLDASKFDMHVSKAALNYEHSFYHLLFPGSSQLRWLLKQQLVNKGVAWARDGTVKFKLDGTRCSGDLNTSLGNCIIMCALIYAYSRWRGIDVELANNGDDCVVFMEREHALSFRVGLSEWFKRKGFAMTVEDTVDEFERVEFCQSRPVQLSTGWRMVRNLLACLQKDPMCLLDIPNDKVLRKWYAAIGTCGDRLTRGVPVLNEFYQLFLREGTSCSDGMLQEVFRNRSQLILGLGLASGVVDAQSRVSFYYAFGVTPDEQVRIEQHFKTASIENLVNNVIDRGHLEINPGFNVVTESN